MTSESRGRLEAVLEAIRLAPGCRRLVDDLQSIWHYTVDPSTPRWQSALLLVAFLQGIAALSLEATTALALRIIVAKAFLESRDAASKVVPRLQSQAGSNTPEEMAA